MEALGSGLGGSLKGRGLGDLGCGMSRSVLEELEEIERACLQRSSALQEEESFVETLGKADSSVEA